MKINPRGYWENKTDEGHGVDPSLAEGIVQYLKKYSNELLISVLDIGCGNGYYTKYLKDRHIYCKGYDGNPFTKQITDGLCEVADFTIYQYLGYWSWVLSLEVGEHIDKEYEHIFINNLVRHAREGVIVSWAIPGQGGDGHVNCQDNDYIRDKICYYGFKFDVNGTQFIRNSASLYPKTGYWFKDTLMVFRRF